MSGAGVFRLETLEVLPEATLHEHTQGTQLWFDGLAVLKCSGDLALITHSSKSIVWSSRIADSNTRVVIKHYLDRQHYEAEIGGYLVFRDGPVAQVLHSDANRQLIVLNHLPGRAPRPTREDLSKVIHAYASMHAAAVSNLTLAWPDAQGGELDSCCSADARPVLERHPVSIGDVKPEHIIITQEGARIIDLETWSLQRTVWFDILSLTRFMLPGKLKHANLEWIVRQYCHFRGCSPDEYDVPKIKRCLEGIRGLSNQRDYVEEGLR